MNAELLNSLSLGHLRTDCFILFQEYNTVIISDNIYGCSDNASADWHGGEGVNRLSGNTRIGNVASQHYRPEGKTEATDDISCAQGIGIQGFGRVFPPEQNSVLLCGIARISLQTVSGVYRVF